VLDVVALFGFVRETNYGRFFDVVTEPSPANLANAGVGLGLHTDNPYRDPVPTLQLLHCLTASESGGETLLCDGVRVAEALRDSHPQDFALLCHNPVRFRYVDDEVDLDFRAPMIETDAAGEVHAVRYNNRSLAPLDLDTAMVADYYRAYRRFSLMLHDASAVVSLRLSPGDLFIVDNRRVLHGRGAFSPGRRHLQGCYADMDSLRSTLRRIERETRQ
jgi:gamma-butyrobetaine dioxygenase